MFLARSVLSWAGPFALSFAFFRMGAGGEEEPQLVVSKQVFKNCMQIASSLWFAWLIKTSTNSTPTRLLIEMFAANVVLDVLVLLPMTGMQVQHWAVEIGALYLTYFACMGVFVGALEGGPQQEQRRRGGRRVHRFVLVAIPLVCLVMRLALVLFNRQEEEEEEDYLQVWFLWASGALVGEVFLLAIHTRYLEFAVLFSVLVWAAELLVTRWPVDEYLLVRGLRLLGVMVAFGMVGRAHEKHMPAPRPSQQDSAAAAAAAVRNLVDEFKKQE